MNQLNSGVFGFDKCKGTDLFDDQTDEKCVASNDPYQAYVITSIGKGRFHYVGVGLVYKPEDSDVVIVATTLAPECQTLVEIPIPQLAKDTKPLGSAPRNVFKVTPTEQVEAVNTLSSP